MLIRFALLGFLSITCLSIIVNAKDLSKHQAKPSPLETLVKKTIATGEDGQVSGNLAKDFDFTSDLKTKEKGNLAEECVDKRARGFVVALDNGDGDPKPAAVILQSLKKGNTASESHLFKLSPEGILEKAFTVTVKFDEHGKPVQGSGIKVDMEPDDAKRLLKKELDFWLKGVGMKKVTKKKETS